MTPDATNAHAPRATVPEDGAVAVAAATRKIRGRDRALLVDFEHFTGRDCLSHVADGEAPEFGDF